MKIATYNLRNGGNTQQDNQWSRLMRRFKPDIVCAQESKHPEKYFSPEEMAAFKGCVYEHVPHGKWGTAILSRTHVLEALSLPELNGWAVAARVPEMIIGGVGQPVIILCVHAPSPGPYLRAVGNILDHFAKIWDRTPLIIGGDFNVTTAIRHLSETSMQNSAGERQLLTRLRREFGVVNAWQTLCPNENLPQTLRWSRNAATPYHCDAVFLSHHFLPHLVSVSVESDGDWTTISDHNPIVVTLA